MQNVRKINFSLQGLANFHLVGESKSKNILASLSELLLILFVIFKNFKILSDKQ